MEDGGAFHTPVKGIGRGAALSPLLAAFHLYNVDTRMATRHPRVRYVRYMDDFLLLVPTRRAVRDLKHALEDDGFTLHPDKTQPGYTARGFDWMGLWFTESGGQTFAPRAINRHREQRRRLYEQIRHLSPRAQALRMAQYCERWARALVPRGHPDVLLNTGQSPVYRRIASDAAIPGVLSD